MNVCLVSFFKSTNLGDLLLSKQLSKSFGKLYKVKIVDFSSAREVMLDDSVQIEVPTSRIKKCSLVKSLFLKMYNWLCFRYGKNLKRRIKTVLSNTDCLVIGGGNMIMGREFFPYYLYLVYLYAKIATDQKKKVYLLAVGVGPLKNRIHYYYLKKILDLCTCKYVRDEASKKICDLIKKDVLLSGDAAMTYTPAIETQNSKRCVGVCFGSYDCVNDFFSFEEYAVFAKGCIDQIKSFFPDREIILFSTESKDYVFINYVAKSCFGIAVKEINCLDDLEKLYNNIELIISMRMHAIIIGMCASVPTIGLAWQDKLKSLFEMARMQSFLFDLRKDKLDALLKIFKRLNADDSIKENLSFFVAEQRKKFENAMETIITSISREA